MHPTQTFYTPLTVYLAIKPSYMSTVGIYMFLEEVKLNTTMNMKFHLEKIPNEQYLETVRGANCIFIHRTS